MRAFAIDEFGATGSIHDLPIPDPEDGQVRVRVEAASINPADLGMLGGAFKAFMEHRFPLIPGLDFGGTVDAVGPAVDGLAIGDAVFGIHGKSFVGGGALAEFTIALTHTIARRSPSIDAAFGAALSLAGASALKVTDSAGLQPGDVVVVVGASGGIGSIAVQLVTAAGAVPIGVARSVNHPYLRDLGVRAFIDYETQDVAQTVAADYPTGVSAVFDFIGDRDLNDRLADHIRPGGHLISMVGAADAVALATRSVTGVNIQTRATTDQFDRLAALVEAGTIRRPTIRTLPLDRAGEGLADIAEKHVQGKIVVEP